MQTLSVAYYVKQIHDQVDTGLFIPGVQIGLYSAVNLQYGAVHGIDRLARAGGLGSIVGGRHGGNVTREAVGAWATSVWCASADPG